MADVIEVDATVVFKLLEILRQQRIEEGMKRSALDDGLQSAAEQCACAKCSWLDEVTLYFDELIADIDAPEEFTVAANRLEEKQREAWLDMFSVLQSVAKGDKGEEWN